MKKAKISSLILFLINMLGFGFIGFFFGYLFTVNESFGKFLIDMVFAVMIAGLAMLLHIIIHETGHLIFGLMTGYKFNSFRILNIMWQKDSDGKIRSYRFSLAGTGGQCIMSPPEIQDGKMPFFLYNIGGVAMNLCLSVLFTVIYFIFKGNPYFDFVCLSFIALGLSMGLANGIPLPEITNDGRNIIELSKSEKAVKAFYTQMQAIVMIQKGIRIKDFPSEWFEMPTDEDLKNVICCIMAVFVCDKLFDEGKYPEAQSAIDALLQKETAIDNVHKQLLKVNALFCELTGEKNKSKIENYLDDDLQSFMKAMQDYPSVIRTQYAYEMLYKNDIQAAQKQADLFEKIALKYPYKVEIKAERECMALAAQIFAD